MALNIKRNYKELQTFRTLTRHLTGPQNKDFQESIFVYTARRGTAFRQIVQTRLESSPLLLVTPGWHIRSISWVIAAPQLLP